MKNSIFIFQLLYCIVQFKVIYTNELIVYWISRPSYDVHEGCRTFEDVKVCIDYPRSRSYSLLSQIDRIKNLKYNEIYKDKIVVIVGPNYTNDAIELIKILNTFVYPIVLPKVSYTHLKEFSKNLKLTSISSSNKQQAKIICDFLIQAKASDISVIYTPGVYEIDILQEINAYIQSINNYNMSLGAQQVLSDLEIQNYEISSTNFILMIVSGLSPLRFFEKLNLIDPEKKITLLFTDLFNNEWNIFDGRKVFYCDTHHTNNWIDVMENINSIIIKTYINISAQHKKINHKENLRKYVFNNFSITLQRMNFAHTLFVGKEYKIFYNENMKPNIHFMYSLKNPQNISLIPNFYQENCQPVCFDLTKKNKIDNVCWICQDCKFYERCYPCNYYRYVELSNNRDIIRCIDLTFCNDEVIGYDVLIIVYTIMLLIFQILSIFIMILKRKENYLQSSHYEIDVCINIGCMLRAFSILLIFSQIRISCIASILFNSFGLLLILNSLIIKVYNYRRNTIQFTKSYGNVVKILIATVICMIFICLYLYMVLDEIKLKKVRYTKGHTHCLYLSCYGRADTTIEILKLYLYRIGIPLIHGTLLLLVIPIRAYPANWNETMLMNRSFLVSTLFEIMYTILISYLSPYEQVHFLVISLEIVVVNIILIFPFGIIKIYVIHTIRIQNVVLDNSFIFNLGKQIKRSTVFE